MKYSNLDMTQSILSSLGGDEVNSIYDTVESRQVAEIIKQCFFDIATRAKLPEHSDLFQLVASGDGDAPVLMHRPDNVVRIEWIKYNKNEEEDPEINAEPNYQYVNIVPIKQFLDMIHAYDITQENIESFELSDFIFFFENDRQPEYCTILRDQFVVFDAYNSEFDTTLQSSKTQCYGQLSPTFEMTNEFVPGLDVDLFPLLLNEAKSQAFFELKQMPHEKAELNSRRQWRSLQHKKHLSKPNAFDQLPDFGRRNYGGYLRKIG
jgi:hypothetical protein